MKCNVTCANVVVGAFQHAQMHKCTNGWVRNHVNHWSRSRNTMHAEPNMGAVVDVDKKGQNPCLSTFACLCMVVSGVHYYCMSSSCWCWWWLVLSSTLVVHEWQMLSSMAKNHHLLVCGWWHAKTCRCLGSIWYNPKDQIKIWKNDSNLQTQTWVPWYGHCVQQRWLCNYWNGKLC